MPGIPRSLSISSFLALAAAVAASLLGGCGFGSGGSGKTLISIQVTPANPSVAVGQMQQFKVIGTFSDGSMAEVTNAATWDSSQPAVAMITVTGLASAMALGRPLITATVATGENLLTGSTTLIIVGARAAGPSRYAYVANLTSNTISAFTINAASGALGVVPGSPFAAGAGFFPGTLDALPRTGETPRPIRS